MPNRRAIADVAIRGALFLGALAACSEYDGELLTRSETGQATSAVAAVCGDGKLDRGEQCDTAIARGASGACVAECVSSDPCELQVLSENGCATQCLRARITSARDHDGCCPGGVDPAADSDCTATCGDSRLEPQAGETCEPGLPGANCPEACDDGLACTLDRKTGSPDQCDVQCIHTPIEQPANGDGCCPAGAHAGNDSDCNAVCGNGIVEAGELCDGDGHCGAACTPVLHPSIVHRYRFDGSGTRVLDSAGDADGTVVAGSLSSSGALQLDGGSSEAHVDLPNGIISALSDATFELWVSWLNHGEDHVRLFDFGSNESGEGNQGTSDLGYLYLSGGYDTNRHPRLSFRRDGGETVLVSGTGEQQFPTEGVQHIAAVFDDSNDELRLYLNGVLLKAGDLASDDHLAALQDDNNWLGRSQFMQDVEFEGTLYEFRIYDQALSTPDLEASFAAGADP